MRFSNLFCLHLVTALAILGLTRCAPTFAAGQHRSSPTEAAMQYKALLKEFRFTSSSGRPLSDKERLKFVGRYYKLRNKLSAKLVKLAEKYPDDPIALEALIQAVWHVNTTPWPVELVGKNDASAKALALLQRKHIRSEKLGTVCHRISFGFCQDYESFLRAVSANNPHKSVRGLACLGLAHYLTNRLHRLDLIKDQPKLAKEFAELYGAQYLKHLRMQDRDQTRKVAETFFEQAAKNYASVKLPYGGTVGKKAETSLFEIRRLSIGSKALDIIGRDQDGKRFKLSDYRGKVVLLDFWSEY